MQPAPRIALPDPDELPERQLRMLVRISSAVAAANGFDEVIETAADSARDALGCASLTISRFEPEAGLLRVLITSEDDYPHERRRPADETYALDEFALVRRLLEEGTPYLTFVDDPGSDAAEVRLLQEIGMGSSAAVPLVVDDRIWGELFVATAPGRPGLAPADLTFLQAVCGQVALALSRAELFSGITQAAYEDPLTGLANRRAFEERLAANVDKARADGSVLTLVLGDVNGLKLLNDTAGHEAGDAALRKVGRALAALAEPRTLAARIGGDEFALLLEGRSAAEAERLVAGLTIALGEADPVVRVSWGAAAFTRGMTEARDLLEAADRAQYASKRDGGRRAPGTRGPVAPVVATPGHDTVELADLCVAALDSIPGADRAQRLMRLARELGDGLDTSRWTIMRRDPGSDLNRTVVICDRRTLGDPVMLENAQPYGRGTVPLVDDLLDASSSRLFHPESDGDRFPAEAAWLARVAATSCLLASVVTPAGGDGLLLYGDHRTTPLAAVRQLTRLLLAAV